MANEQNLKPLNTRTKDERRKIAVMGGKASGKARRDRKTFKDSLLLALETIQEDGKTIQDIGIESLMGKYKNGDLKAFEIVRDTVGEKPTEVHDIKVVETDWFK